ncbi:MAG: multifunctional CCA addition/repair protein [Candidatus Contendobacter sp.]|nr:multifunctional CCA addition/repair protein [Candidatus Contendobacter sp.]MDG4556270.1 multifunctional CCA addition/repair protein [Candidatus Contendobacter sp.]
MEIYLVGGAVRDGLLGRPVNERDWVVVGATPDDLLARGFRPVGKDFPVFLHPDTREEYALARTERKTGPGYHGFSVHAAPNVTLEDDLLRRDLTINAMARDVHGRLIDPCHGRRDLEDRWLRHVSPAFAEDPVRVLRLARFSARYAPLGFRVAPETLALLQTMVASGEMDHLTPERVWMETARALGEPRPSRFVATLRECGALARIFPELDRLFGVPQSPAHHPEVDTGAHILLALDQAARMNADPVTRFAVLAHDLGKGVTPPGEWPRHLGHEQRGPDLARALCQRLRVPNMYRELGVLTARYHTHCHRSLELRPKTLLNTLHGLDALRKPQRFEQFLVACEADARGRLGLENRDYAQADFMRRMHQAAARVQARPLVEQGLTGLALAEALYRHRLAAIAEARREFKTSRHGRPAAFSAQPPTGSLIPLPP